MKDSHQTHRKQVPADGSRSSKVFFAVIGFLFIGGLLLAYEHRVHLLTGNALIVALLLLCFGMHFFMHGNHGGQDK